MLNPCLFLGPRIWDLTPNDLKLSESLSISKEKAGNEYICSALVGCVK